MKKTGTVREGNRRLLLWSLLLLSLCMALAGCTSGDFGKTADPVISEGEQKLKATFFDVGKGDAILLESAGQAMLIDTGYDDSCQRILDYLEKQKIRKLDLLVITHFDKDHVGGADKILDAVQVERVVQPDYDSASRQSEEYRQALEGQGMTPERIREKQEFSFGESLCQIWPPEKDAYEEPDNDFSLVLRVACGETAFLFTGDSQEERLAELLGDSQAELKAQVLKVPHHGRKEKNSREFLEAVSPEIAVITCSKEETPSGKIIKRLQKLGTEIYLTSEGSVTCVTDGRNILCSQEAE